MAMFKEKNVTDQNGEDSTTTMRFQPVDCTKAAPKIKLPDEIWMTVLESPCTFPPAMFEGIMLNLIKNPNISSSLLFRADILYDSGESADFKAQDENERHDNQFHAANIPSYEMLRLMVRKLIPRNSQLDPPLRQTCYFFQRIEQHVEHNVVLYVPHVDRADDMPFYHPAVAKLAFQHSWDHSAGTGTASISYGLFPETTLSTKLERTALKLLQTIHKHGQGQLAGYEKRVHLDQIIPQKRYQDTYAELKAKYGRQLSEKWVEVTDPGKHVFEDIGIAAYLIELWRDMYRSPSCTLEDADGVNGHDSRPDTTLSEQTFPGFVDIGCGNGILTYILITEGYPGWGFDARQRKTWSMFPEHVQQKLQQRLLVPQVFQTSTSTTSDEGWHSGIFEPGTFIVSNHADELTAWTPLLAHLNHSAFIAIPCCSHDLSGARFRAPATTKAGKQASARLPQQEVERPNADTQDANGLPSGKHASETGSLKRNEAQKKMPSAYSTLCSYVTSLAEEVGFEAEKDVLRIPSTRNQCILARKRKSQSSAELAKKQQQIAAIIETELNKSVAMVGAEWVERAAKLSKKPASGH